MARNVELRVSCGTMLLQKWTVGRLCTPQTSFNPIPYVCCWQFLRRSNFENTVFARWPWHPSPNNVSFAWNSIPRSKFAYSMFDVEIYNFRTLSTYTVRPLRSLFLIYSSQLRLHRKQYFKNRPEAQPIGTEQQFRPEPEPSLLWYRNQIKYHFIMEWWTKRHISDEKWY